MNKDVFFDFAARAGFRVITYDRPGLDQVKSVLPLHMFCTDELLAFAELMQHNSTVSPSAAMCAQVLLLQARVAELEHMIEKGVRA